MSDAQKPVSKQEKAIYDYLQSLLMDITDDSESDTPVDTDVKLEIKPEVKTAVVELAQHEEPISIPSVVGLEQLVAEVPDEIEPVEEKVEAAIEVESIVEEVAIVEPAVEPAVELGAVLESPIPNWAETRFQCLLFKVGGLSLAVPLVKLNSVIPWDDTITETPNQTEWYLGLVQHLESQVKIIDMALLVLPENRRGNLSADKESRLGHILLVDNFKWGLACESIGDVIWMTKDEVKWRKDKKQRAWMAGTSLEHLCAVIDTEVFAQMLNQA